MIDVMTHDDAWVAGGCDHPELGVYAGWVAQPGSQAARHNVLPDYGRGRLVLCGEWDSEVAAAGAANATPSLFDRYEKQHGGFFDGLNGLFSGLLIDRQRRCAQLFNDRYGLQRLYVHHDGGDLYFASEAKALLALLPGLRKFDDRGVADFLTFGSVLEGRTLFRGVSVLPGASLWTTRSRNAPIEQTTYFQPAQWEALPALSDTEFTATLDQTLRTVLPRHLHSPRELGISLTGGLDTRMIMACLPSTTRPATTYTYADQFGDTLDVRIAARVAQVCGVPHQTLRLDAAFMSAFSEHVDRSIYLTDGNAPVLTSHELYLSRQAASLAPIRLTGNYGSEVLRGMSTFKRAHLAAQLVHPDFSPMLDRAAHDQAARRDHPVTQAAFREIPWHLFGPLAAARTQLVFRTPYMDNALVKLAYQGSPAMRASPRPSLDLVRNNHPALAAIATDRGVRATDNALQSWIRRTASTATFKLDYWHMDGMPRRLSMLNRGIDALAATKWLDKHKFLPYRRWLRGPLADHLRSALDNAAMQRLPCWHERALRELAADHISGRHNRLREINAVLTLEAVNRLLIHGTHASRRRTRADALRLA